MITLIPGVVYDIDDKWWMATDPTNLVTFTQGERIDGSLLSIDSPTEVRLYTVKELKNKWEVTESVIDKLGLEIFPRVEKTRIEPSDVIKIYKLALGGF